MSENKRSENKRDYEVGRGKPPVHTRFKKGQSGNPRGPQPKNLAALLIEALDEPVTATIEGERREITKREAVATQLVNKSTGADLRATKMLIDTPAFFSASFSVSISILVARKSAPVNLLTS